MAKTKVRAVPFINWTDEDFTHSWDGVEYTFKAGEKTYLPDWQVKHFGKHLVDRELNKQGLTVRHYSRTELEGRCIGEEVIEADDANSLEAKRLNVSNEIESEPEAEVKEEKRFCDQCDSKGVRHKKECPTNNADEDSFAGK